MFIGIKIFCHCTRPFNPVKNIRAKVLKIREKIIAQRLHFLITFYQDLQSIFHLFQDFASAGKNLPMPSS